MSVIQYDATCMAWWQVTIVNQVILYILCEEFDVFFFLIYMKYSYSWNTGYKISVSYSSFSAIIVPHLTFALVMELFGKCKLKTDISHQYLSLEISVWL